MYNSLTMKADLPAIEKLMALAVEPELECFLVELMRKLRAAARLPSAASGGLPGPVFDWPAIAGQKLPGLARHRPDGEKAAPHPENKQDDIASDTERTLKVLVGVSGGSDSISLLLFLTLLSRRGWLDVFACHVNHKLRGAESDEDEEFVKEACARWAVPLSIYKSESERPKSEQGLRDYRYSVLTDCAHQVGANIIAVAHTLDDQAETLLFRAFRGSSLSGLRGIPAVRPFGADVILVRPFLDNSRLVLRDLLEKFGVGWREDSSNALKHYTRNYIRHELVPRIQARFPDFDERLERTRRIIVEEEALMASLADRALEEVESEDANLWSGERLRDLPVALQRRVIAAGMAERGVEIMFERVEAILSLLDEERTHSGEHSAHAGSGKRHRLTLDDRWDIETFGDQFKWLDKGEQPEPSLEGVLPLNLPGLTILATLGRAVRIERYEDARPLKKEDFPPADALEAFVDLDEVRLPLTVRLRRAGDIIRPFGMKETVKLKKYLHTHKGGRNKVKAGMEAKASADKQAGDEGLATGTRCDAQNVVGTVSGVITASPRARMLRLRNIVLADQDEVLWVPGVGISEKLRVRQ
ncbi:MAG TPA: tRNA lysidine(34) synthetase TilS, partial [Candidatus Obscuribacterales bacterium]